MQPPSKRLRLTASQLRNRLKPTRRSKIEHCRIQPKTVNPSAPKSPYPQTHGCHNLTIPRAEWGHTAFCRRYQTELSAIPPEELDRPEKLDRLYPHPYGLGRTLIPRSEWSYIAFCRLYQTELSAIPPEELDRPEKLDRLYPHRYGLGRTLIPRAEWGHTAFCRRYQIGPSLIHQEE